MFPNETARIKRKDFTEHKQIDFDRGRSNVPKSIVSSVSHCADMSDRVKIADEQESARASTKAECVSLNRVAVAVGEREGIHEHEANMWSRRSRRKHASSSQDQVRQQDSEVRQGTELRKEEN